MIPDHPLRQDGASAAYDAGNTASGERNVLHQNAGVNGHVVDTLFRLFLDDFKHYLNIEIFHPAYTRKRLVNRNGPDRDRGFGDYCLADSWNIPARG